MVSIQGASSIAVSNKSHKFCLRLQHITVFVRQLGMTFSELPKQNLQSFAVGQGIEENTLHDVLVAPLPIPSYALFFWRCFVGASHIMRPMSTCLTASMTPQVQLCKMQTNRCQTHSGSGRGLLSSHRDNLREVRHSLWKTPPRPRELPKIPL